MGDPVADLRTAVTPYECVRGPNPGDDGATAVIRIGAGTEVTIELAASGRASVSAASPDAAPLYVDLDLDALGAVRVRTSDAGFAAALIAGLDARLRRALANRGVARLGFGRWQIARPGGGVLLRELAETVALLAARPAAIAREWSAAARALGGHWDGPWSARGDAAFAIGDVELVHRIADDDGGAPLLRTEAIAGAQRASLPGLVVEPAALAALITRVGGVAPALRAPLAREQLPAPMPFADWPAARRGAISIGPGPDRIWVVRPTDGRDPAPGLDEELTLDGVAVRTSCDDRLATTIRADAPGAAGLRVEARPGYRFLRGWLWPDPQLGDRGFDDRYVLATDDVAWSRWWLGATERDAIAATFAPEAAHPFAFAIRDGELAFSAARPDRHAVDAARRAAAFLATRGDRAAAEWRHLAGPLGATVVGETFAPDRGLALRTGRGAIAIELAAITGSDGRLATRAHVLVAEGDDRGPHLALCADRAPDRLAPARGRRDPATRAPPGYAARTTDQAWAAARLAAIAPALALARPELVELDGPRASVTWSGPLLDVPRLTAGVDLLARAVRDATLAVAPYR